MTGFDPRVQAEALVRQGRLREAAAMYQGILRQRVDVLALHNLAVILGQLGFADAALEAMQKVVELRGDFADAWRNLGAMYSRRDRVDAALTAYRRAIALQPQFADAHSSLLRMLQFQSPHDAAAVAGEHREFGRGFADPITASSSPPPAAVVRDIDASRRLRVGYVSPDFREHSVGFFIEPVLARHRAEQVEVFCYSDVANEDATTARLKSYGHEWREVRGLDHEQLARQIREDAIDVLVDLAGHSGNNRLLTFARRPAAVQVSFLGYAATTGVSAIQYRLTDAHADPPGMTERFWSETLIRLPRTAWCYRPPVESPAANAKLHTPITFGCFGRRAKYSPQVIAMWRQILQRVPKARLVLKSVNLDDGIIADLGVEPRRIELLPRTDSTASHLAAYNDIDIALDTFPYHGTTTTCEALWMGVPVITRAGESHMSRVGVSLLSNVGLAELIAESDEAYVELAVALANDRKRLSAQRRDLRERMKQSPLMDEQAFAADLESAYRTLILVAR